MQKTNLFAILMAFVCCGLYSCSSDPLQEHRVPATRALAADFDEFYSNLQQFVDTYADQSDLPAGEKETRDKYIFSAGLGSWYASPSFVEPDIYNAVYLGWKVERALNPSTRSVMDAATLEYLETLRTTTYTVDHASRILPGTLTLKSIPDLPEEPSETTIPESEYDHYIGSTATYGDILDILKNDLGALFYSPLLSDALMMELLIPRVTAITGGVINESEAREKMEASNGIMEAAFQSSVPFTTDSGISYLKTLYPTSDDELSVLGLYMSKLSRLESTVLRRIFTTGFIGQFDLYPGALTDSQYERISAAVGTAYNSLEYWIRGNDASFLIATPASLLFSRSIVQQVEIESNTQWWIVNRVQWLHVDRNNGAGNGILTVTAQENFTGQDRTGRFQIVYLIDEHTEGTMYIDVKQVPPPIYFDVSEENQTYYGAGTGGFFISSNTNWRVISAPDFIYGYAWNGSNNYPFTFSLRPIGDHEARIGELIFGYDDNGVELTKSVWIDQWSDAPYAHFEILNVPRFDYLGSITPMYIKTNSEWTISSLSNWLTVISISPYDEDIFEVRLSASRFNGPGTSREGQITFRYYDQYQVHNWVNRTIYPVQDGPL